ncbi:hypothetical protein KSP40_PGU015743 [Platanthera guangdongensis]|uniref:Receptor ligand binding region domain-containing protein n=1 Tax=Platanthera guangdongensis TaxID=2320717 RepID=A0ABR2MW39_9ASPA
MGAVREVVLDESVIFDEDAGGNTCLRPASATLLRRLRFSNLRVGICYQDYDKPQKATFVKEIASTHSLDCISLSGTYEESFNEFLQAWSGTASISLFITSKKHELFFSKLKKMGWRIVYVGVDHNDASDGAFNINKLDSVPITICSLNRMQAMKDRSVLTIGYVMKQSREEDFSKAERRITNVSNSWRSSVCSSVI